ncbi:hypothetical protein [Halorhabdus salina]|uniref:hypothetical protein n=1 Tax=Halorhabdus salina TaxID=2750670 RepID=UPI0015EEF99C|nr:hypothetical protein [Halorhabdus salina]
MQNACFRCREPIPSGGTFCRDCQSKVSLSGAAVDDVSGWWLAVAGGSIGFVVAIALTVVAVAVSLTAITMIATIVMVLSIGGFFIGLYADMRFIQRRNDLEWSPSDWYLTVLLFCSLFLLTIPFVSVYYLYRRRQRIGLPR